MGQVIGIGFDTNDGITILPVQPIGSSGTPSTAGTPTPTDNLFIIGNNGNVIDTEEDPESPDIEWAEQCTFDHTYRTAWQNCLVLGTLLPRGTFLQDTQGNIWRVLSVKIKHLRGTAGQINIVAESISFDTPPDDFSVIPVELGIDIIKHPRYSWAILPYVSDASTYYSVGDTGKIYFNDLKSSIVRMIQMYRDSPYYPSADYVNGLIQNNVLNQLTNGSITVTIPNPNYAPPASGTNNPGPTAVPWDGNEASLTAIGTGPLSLVVTLPSGTINLNNPNDPIAIALAAATEIISKLWRQEDTPYVVGYQITWTQYFFAPIYENPGGYTENPIGIVPYYFTAPPAAGTLYSILPRSDIAGGYPPGGNMQGDNMDTVQGVSTPTLFDQLVAINPQCYSSDGTISGNLAISWLRKADEVDYQRTWFKVTRTWIGSPIGHWDSDLYHQIGVNGPQSATDFNILPTAYGSRQGA